MIVQKVPVRVYPQGAITLVFPEDWQGFWTDYDNFFLTQDSNIDFDHQVAEWNNQNADAPVLRADISEPLK